MTAVPEETIKVTRDPVRDWRFKECLRILGIDADIMRAVDSDCDLHALERLTAKAGPKLAIEILA